MSLVYIAPSKAVARKINVNARFLSGNEAALIRRITADTVDPGPRTGIDLRTAILNFGPAYVMKGTVPWLASVFAHEGTHLMQYSNGMVYRGSTAARLERETDDMQIRVGAKNWRNIE